ncbi:MAG: C25 family cysteine peptidase, partial [Anaerolineae bacterium]|nr:C25 family cysteine peptidase [Anaerolineae bacterium]
MGTRDGSPGGAPTPVAFATTAHLEENHAYQAHIPSGADGGDHWFWKYAQATSTAVTNTITFSLHHPIAEPYTATISGHLYGYSYFGPTPDHHTQVFLNGHLVDDATWDGWRDYIFEHDIPGSYLLEGENTIQLVLPFDLDPSVINDIVFINWFEVGYKQAYTATDNLLDFTIADPGTWNVRVRGYTTDTLSVLDITTPTVPVRVISPTVAPDGGNYTLRFQDVITGSQRYLALAPSRVLSPTAVFSDTPSNLHDLSNGADYIAIAHSDFVTDVLPLVDFRAAQGVRALVVDVQDIYDEFSYGVFDPQAIHDFLDYAYHNWTPPAPAYVLLVGDGNFDFKNYLGRGEPNYIPPFLAYVDPWIGEVAADNRYVTVVGEDILPDMHLGRLPVKTPAEAAAMVSKIIAYEQSPPSGDWNQKLTFVADNPDDAGEFYDLSDAIADHLVPTPYITGTIYYQQTHGTASGVKTAIKNAVNAGRLMVNYIGHATIQFWGFEHLFDHTDIAGLTNGGMLPFVTPMTCLDGYYIHPSPSGTDISSIGEVFVRAPGKGAVASWSPTGMGLATGHDYLNQGLYEAIFQDDVAQLGPATTLAKYFLYAETGGYPEL